MAPQPTCPASLPTKMLHSQATLNLSSRHSAAENWREVSSSGLSLNTSLQANTTTTTTPGQLCSRQRQSGSRVLGFCLVSWARRGLNDKS